MRWVPWAGSSPYKNYQMVSTGAPHGAEDKKTLLTGPRNFAPPWTVTRPHGRSEKRRSRERGEQQPRPRAGAGALQGHEPPEQGALQAAPIPGLGVLHL